MTRFSAIPAWTKSGLAATLATLALFALAPAAAQAEETHIFDATLSLTGSCATNTLDPVPDPGTCPGVAGVDHPAKRFKVPHNIATDEYGDIYVANKSGSGEDAAAVIDVFTPTGHFITEVPDHRGVERVAVDSEGNLYAHRNFVIVSPLETEEAIVLYHPKVYKPQSGEIEYETTPTYVVAIPSTAKAKGFDHAINMEPGDGIAVDRSDDHLFLNLGTSVAEFGSAAEGNPLLDDRIGAETREKYVENIKTYDSEGNLIGNTGGEEVDIGPAKNRFEYEFTYNGEGKVVEEIIITQETGPVLRKAALLQSGGRSIAIDAANHDIYVDSGKELSDPDRVLVLDGEDPNHPLLHTIDGSCLPDGHFNSNTHTAGVSIAIDESNGHVFVDDRASSDFAKRFVYEFTETGQCVSTIEHGFENTTTSEIAIDNGAHSPNGALDPNGRYLYVPSGEIGTKSHVYAFAPVAKVGGGKPKLTVSKTGTGTGTVSGGSVAEPATINCGSGTGCEHEYEEGAVITLSQSPTAGSEFKGWTGCTSEEAGKCKVTLSAAKAVSAKFDLKPIPEYTLTVTVTGEGEVSADTGTISGCTTTAGPACKSPYKEGTKVTLTETPGPGQQFDGWGTPQCDESTATTCQVTIGSGDEGVTASFIPKAKPKFKLSVAKAGAGKVTSTPAGIDCGSACSFEYEEGKEVELKETPEAGSEFVKWSGACSGSGICKVTMSEARSITAEFKLIPKAKFVLKVKTTGSGTGKVTGPGIDCGATCEAEFEEGTKVTLAQSATAGSKFIEWSGACTGSGSCEVTMSAAKEVSAKFDLVPKFKLTVAKTGTGTGAVTSSPAGISCGATCSAEYESGKEVELKETPEAGSEFVKWGGACSGTGNCKVTMSSTKEVSAEFKLIPKAKFKLTVAKSGTGAGTVTSTPAGISCGVSCAAEYEEGKVVELKAEASAGSKFSEWSGACTGTGSCKVTMSAAKAVGAKFDLIPVFKLTISKSGTGTGTVTSSPAGIDCGTTCSAEYEAGEEVELKAEASSSSEFLKWSGACTGTGPCQVTMSSAKSVVASFKATPTYRLLIAKSGTGTGRVTSSAPIADIDCGSSCEAKFPLGTEVELTATPDPGSEFFKWSGACSGTAPCELTMNAAKTAHATFKAIPAFALSVTKTGSGMVISSPAGIECGAQCTHEYASGTTLTLSATPTRGYRFGGWSGCDSAAGASCTVTMNSARSVGATFVLAKCKRGFHPKKVNGKARCVRSKRHASHRRRGRSSRADLSSIGWSF
jgi:Fe-S cluster biogenesis protein NfuA